MPHRPEDTTTDPPRERPGETRDQAVEGTLAEGPRVTGDTQPPAPKDRSAPGRVPEHGARHWRK